MCDCIDENIIFMDVYSVVTICNIVSMYLKSMRKGFVKKMIYSRFDEADKFKNIFCKSISTSNYCFLNIFEYDFCDVS